MKAEMKAKMKAEMKAEIPNSITVGFQSLIRMGDGTFG